MSPYCSGLLALRAVLSCGLKAVVLEKGSSVGGVWNQAYDGLHVQGARACGFYLYFNDLLAKGRHAG